MAKRRAGLHKEITSIFDGVPITRNNTRQDSGSRDAERTAPTGPSRFDKTRLTPPMPPKPQRAVTPTPEAAQPAQPKRGPGPSAKPEKVKTVISRKASGPGLWQQIQNKLFKSKPNGATGRQKAAAMLVPVLSVVLIIAFVRILGPKGSRVHPAESKPTGAVTPQSEVKIDWQSPEPYPKALRDPMKFAAAEPVQSGTEVQNVQQVFVTGVIWSDDNPLAIIGSEVVGEGQVVSGVTVVNINKDSVELEKDGKRWTQKVQ